MGTSLSERIKNAYSAFMREDRYEKIDIGQGYYYRPDRMMPTIRTERTIINAIFNRIAMDVAATPIRVVQLDENGLFKNYKNGDPLDICLTLEANIDQTGKEFVQDAVYSVLTEGAVALVPTETDRNPDTGAYKIYSLRVGKILEWYPQHVKVRVYDQRDGHKKDVILRKDNIGIYVNPLYEVVNEPNSIMQKLVKKLNIMDVVDERTGVGKLDVIIQLPYAIKSQARKDEAEHRRQQLETQLNGSRYGVAYADGTEKIVQLNRPLENNLLSHIEYLTSMLYSQLGITEAILNGTADENSMQNYYQRTIAPIITALVEEMTRKFLSPTVRAQNTTIMFFNDPFKLIPVGKVADIADKFTRNEILSSNEVRSIVGRAPVNDPRANELRNKNLNAGKDQTFASVYGENGDDTSISEESVEYQTDAASGGQLNLEENQNAN